MKTCKSCGDEKQLDEFYKDKTSKDGRHSQCKACKTEYLRSPDFIESREKYNKSPKGIATRMWHHIKGRVGKNEYKNVSLEMSQKEFLRWAVPRVEEFIKKHNGVPSIDRINPDDNYRLDNIRILSLEKNVLRSRIIIKQCKVDMNGSRKSKVNFAIDLFLATCDNMGLILNQKDVEYIIKRIGE